VSIHAFLLDGWDHTSIWGLDVDHYYAQLTPNGVDDSDGPQISISPPRYVISSATELLRHIAQLIEVPVDTVDEAMVRGMAMSRGQLVTPVPLPETDR
jgi:hypothetical protein